MSYISQALQCAPNIQVMLAEAFNANGQNIVQEQYPFLQFLASEANNYGLRMKVSSTPNRVKTVEVLYQQRILETDVSSNIANPTCTATAKRGNLVAEYTIDSAVNVGITQLIDNDDLTCTNLEFGAFLSSQILRMVDAVDRKLASQAATQAVALAGVWSADAESSYTVASDRLQIDIEVNNQIAPFGYHQIQTAAQMTGYSSQKILFGGATMHDYLTRSQFGCCSNQGMDLNAIWAQYGLASAYDRFLASALGDKDYSLMTQPGALALLWFTKAGWNNGATVNIGSNYAMTGIISPNTGIPMDLTLSDNCGNLSITLIATTKVVGLPTDMFSTNDNLDGVTFVNKVEAV